MIYRFFGFSNKGDLTSLLPNNTALVVDIHINQFAKDIFKQMKQGRDISDLSLVEIRELLKENEEDLIGFDNRRQLVFFQNDFKGIKTNGLLFHIKNLRKFKQYKEKNKYIIRKANKDYGVILYLENKSAKEEIAYYEQLAEKIINSSIHKKGDEGKDFIKVKFNGKNQEFITLAFQLDDNQLKVKGKAKFHSPNPIKKDSIFKIIPDSKSSFFHLTLAQTPFTFNDLLANFLRQINLEIPTISSQDIVIYNTKIEAVNKSLTVLPELDWIIRFSESFNLKKHFDTLVFPSYLTYNAEEMSVQVQKEKYYFQQLSEDEIYIGSSAHPQFNLESNILQTNIIGQPSVLFHLEGETFIGYLIRSAKPIKVATHFLENLADFEVQFQPISDNESTIEGTFSLPEDETMSIFLLNLFLK